MVDLYIILSIFSIHNFDQLLFWLMIKGLINQQTNNNIKKEPSFNNNDDDYYNLAVSHTHFQLQQFKPKIKFLNIKKEKQNAQ